MTGRSGVVKRESAVLSHGAESSVEPGSIDTGGLH